LLPGKADFVGDGVAKARAGAVEGAADGLNAEDVAVPPFEARERRRQVPERPVRRTHRRGAPRHAMAHVLACQAR
jgi:hypothetical protein